MPSEYALADVLERMYQSQLAFEAALELTLHAEAQGHADFGDNVRGELYTHGFHDKTAAEAACAGMNIDARKSDE